MATLNMGWAAADRDVQEYVAFFLDQVTQNNNTDFVSFGEITDGRAISMDSWSPNLREVLAQEIAAGLSLEKPTNEYMRIFEAREDDILVAYALLSFHPTAESPHVWLQDVIVDEKRRNAGIGGSLVKAIESELRGAGNVKYVFLESSVKKEKAHRFFKRLGFEPSAVVMIKAL